MGRPPHSGGPAFRFIPTEVAEMEACLRESNNAVPAREIIASLADKFSASADRAGKIVVQPKQVWNWFQNRRYAQRAKLVKTPGKVAVPTFPTSTPDDSVPVRNVPISAPIPSDKNSLGESTQMEFEAKSARDGAWYDVATFISHRMFETGDPEVRVRFAGFGTEEDEWVNVRRCLRQRSLPCEAAECVAVIPGDLVLCFQEGKEQALYFDAHILDAQRRRHDVRGCRCRFLVRYDHDQSEEIVPLRKICRRPETDYRLQQMQTSKDHSSLNQVNIMKDPSSVSQVNVMKDPSSLSHVNVMKDPSSASSSRDINAATQKTEVMVNTPSIQANEPPKVETTPSLNVEKNDTAVTVAHGGNAALTVNVNVDRGT